MGEKKFQPRRTGDDEATPTDATQNQNVAFTFKEEESPITPTSKKIKGP